MSAITCPCCGAEIEIEARAVQAELPLGPIEVSKKEEGGKKKELDGLSGESVQSSDSNNDSIRFDHSDKDLIDSIRRIVGETEFELNERLWRKYLQTSVDALSYAVRKWDALTKVQQRSIKNPAGWLTDFYKRGCVHAAKSA